MIKSTTSPPPESQPRSAASPFNIPKSQSVRCCKRVIHRLISNSCPPFGDGAAPSRSSMAVAMAGTVGMALVGGV